MWLMKSKISINFIFISEKISTSLTLPEISAQAKSCET